MISELCRPTVPPKPAREGRRVLDLTKRRPGTVRVLSDPHAARFYERLGAQLVAHAPAPMPGAPDRSLPVYEFSALGRSDPGAV